MKVSDVLIILSIPFFLLLLYVGSIIETIIMSSKGYRYNSGWSRWEKKGDPTQYVKARW